MPKHIHFIEIGGNTMSGLAVAAKLAGATVTGTDENAIPPSTDFLDEHGITWWQSPSPDHLKDVDEVVISGAYPPDYIEIKTAQDLGITIKPFAAYWGDLIKNDFSLVVAGTHGKTTTSALLAWILESAGKKPDYLIGVKPKNFDSSVRFGSSGVAVSEGDEYQASRLEATSKFSYYHPDMLAITSVEMDHPDLFRDLEEVESRFAALVTSLKPEAQLFVCADDPGSAKMAKLANCRITDYGLSKGIWQANNLHFTANGIKFIASKQGQELGEISLGLYGRHNVLNTLAAISMAEAYGLSWQQIVSGASLFKGTARRFSFAGAPSAKVRVIDDYAHHPTAAKATIDAAKLHFGGRVIAVYQPHTFSRTEALLKDYQAAFNGADETFLAPVDANRERHQTARVTSQDIAAGASGKIEAIDDRDQLVKAVLAAARPGDTVLVMSVGGYNKLAVELAAKLEAKYQ